MGAKANSENIPLVHKITKENQKLKEKIAKLEQELQKATTKSFLEKNSKEGIRSALDP
jgi:cell division septum initiation protein DivIVA